MNEQTKRNRTAYFFKRLSTWIGPNLGTLAAAHGVAYDVVEESGQEGAPRPPGSQVGRPQTGPRERRPQKVINDIKGQAV